MWQVVSYTVVFRIALQGPLRTNQKECKRISYWMVKHTVRSKIFRLSRTFHNIVAYFMLDHRMRGKDVMGNSVGQRKNLVPTSQTPARTVPLSIEPATRTREKQWHGSCTPGFLWWIFTHFTHLFTSLHIYHWIRFNYYLAVKNNQIYIVPSKSLWLAWRRSYYTDISLDALFKIPPLQHIPLPWQARLSKGNDVFICKNIIPDVYVC